MGDPIADNESVSEASTRTAYTNTASSTNGSNASTGSRSGSNVSTGSRSGPRRSQHSGASIGQRENTRHQTSTNTFKGNATGMNGNVFQLHSERRKKGQLQETLDALKTLASTEFKQEIRYLEPFFQELTSPRVPLPIKPEPEEFPDPKDATKTIMAINPVKQDIYKEEIKAFVIKEKRLKQAKSALVNIVLGQCSKPMKNKLKGLAGYDEMEQEGNIANLLKSIRDLSNKIEEKCVSI